LISREIFLAEKKISRFDYKTPLQYANYLSKKFNGNIYLKCENYQVTGSFKVRGVFNKLLKLKQEGFSGNVLTVSTGNHGLAVAYASKILGLDSTIVLPKNVIGYKLERIKSFGSRIIFFGSNYDEAEKYARSLVKEGFAFVSPYNDFDIIAGQGTVGLEIAMDLPNVEMVIVPVGGGGLISGIAGFLKETLGRVKVIGVQSEASAPMYHSIRAGKIVKVELKPSIADGLHGNIEENSITFDLVKRYVDDIVVVREKTIIEAMRMLYRYEGKIVEGSAAVTLAALLEEKVDVKGSNIVLVLSGGNIDESHLKYLMEH